MGPSRSVTVAWCFISDYKVTGLVTHRPDKGTPGTGPPLLRLFGVVTVVTDVTVEDGGQVKALHDGGERAR